MNTLAQTVIHLADCPPQPWKNGGGITRELLAWPTKDDWQIRISVADITQNGVFSSFTGVQRSFAVIEGAGVRLRFTNREEVVTQASKPLVFDGTDAPDCTLMDGATRDLNVMCKAASPVTLTCAYAAETRMARGFFDKTTLTLTWLDAAALMTSPSTRPTTSTQTVGWWIEPS